MNIRVTGQTQVANALANIQRQASAVTKYQNQISSGNRVNVPSDDPAAFPALANAKANSAKYAAYLQTISDSTTVLNSSVSSLQEVNDVLVSAKQIASEAASSTTEAGGFEGLATEVDGLIQRALRAGNAQEDGQSLFAGTAAGTTPFTVATTDAQGRPATIAYGGATARSRVITGDLQTTDTRYVGSAVFQSSGADVFASLIALRDNLRNTTFSDTQRAAALNQSITDVDAARAAVSNVTAEQSANLSKLEAVQARITDLKLTADIRTGEIGGTDYAQAIVKMNQEETSFQATIAVSARLLQTSLLDFIR